MNRRKNYRNFFYLIFRKYLCSNISPIFFSREKLFLSKAPDGAWPAKRRRRRMAEKTPVPKFIYGRNPGNLRPKVPRMTRAIRPRNDHPNGSEDAHKKGYLIPKHQRSNGKRRTWSDTYAEVRKMLEDHLKTQDRSVHGGDGVQTSYAPHG